MAPAAIDGQRRRRQMSGPVEKREEALEEIRQAYRRYREQGRDRLWDSATPGYARLTRDRDRAVVELVSRSLPESGAALDLGCGPGGLADLVRARVGALSWTGADLLAENVDEARRLRPWATWVETSADRLPFADGSFDVVVAATLFSSLPTPELERAVAAEAGRVLRPGGWLVWYDLRYDNPRNPDIHGLGRASLARLFPDWHAELRSITLVPPIARRLGPLTPLAYRPLELVPPLRSHLIGRLRKPT
jgi:SAM-dependent methyltransferase